MLQFVIVLACWVTFTCITLVEASPCSSTDGSNRNVGGSCDCGDITCAASEFYCLVGATHPCTHFPLCRMEPLLLRGGGGPSATPSANQYSATKYVEHANLFDCIRCDPNNEHMCAECSIETTLYKGHCLKPQTMVTNAEAMVALLADGTVQVWGDSTAPQHDWNADTNDVNAKLAAGGGARHLAATEHAFAALLSDGSVVAWGDPNMGGYLSHEVAQQIAEGKGAREIYSSMGAFVVLLEDLTLATWGSDAAGGSLSITGYRKLIAAGGVLHIYSVWCGFLAQALDNTTVVSWGDAAAAMLIPKLKLDMIQMGGGIRWGPDSFAVTEFGQAAAILVRKKKCCWCC